MLSDTREGRGGLQESRTVITGLFWPAVMVVLARMSESA